MTEKQSRRTFVKGVAATGTAATGIAAFGGQAAAQEQVFTLDDVELTDVTEQNGLANVDLNVVLTNINVDVVDDIRVRLRDVRILEEGVTVQDIEIPVTIEDVNVQALNNLNVVVQALSDGDVIQTSRQRVEAA